MNTPSPPSRVDVRWFSTELMDLHHEHGYLRMTIERPQTYEFEAGQYATFRLKDDAGDFQRSYSIASAPRFKNQLEFCIRISSDSRGMSYFKKLRPGTTLTLSPPMGEFKIVEMERPLVFIAGGSGISPIRSFIHQLLNPEWPELRTASRMQLLYCCKDATAIPFKKEFEKLAEAFRDRFSVLFFAENGESSGVLRGNVTHALSGAPGAFDPSAHYYLCGPTPMIGIAQEILKQNSILNDHIFFEKY